MIKIFYSRTNMDSNITNEDLVTMNQFLIYQSGSPDDFQLSLIKITSEINKYSTLEITAPYQSKFYKMLKTDGFNNSIFVYYGNILIWKGIILDVEYDIDQNVNVMCVDLFFIILNGIVKLDESTLPPLVGVDKNVYVTQFIDNLFKSFKKEQNLNSIRLGDFEFNTNTGTGGIIPYPISQNNNPYQYFGDVLENQILNVVGGYFFIDYYGDTNRLEYQTGTQLRKNDSQILETGSNIIDIKYKIKKSFTYSGILGVSNDNLGVYKTGYTAFGQIGCPLYQIKSFDIDETNNLTTLTADYFEKNIKNKIPSTELEVKAFDLSLIDSSKYRIQIGRLIRIISKNHSIDDYYLCTKTIIDYLNPENSEYYFGTSGGNISDLKNDYNSKIDESSIYARNSIVNLNKRVTNLGG